MKNLIFSVALTLGITVTQATAGPAEDCYLVSSLVYDIAQARDFGVSPEAAFNAMVDGGLEPIYAAALLQLVYITGSELSPKELKGTVFTDCFAELT